MGWCLGPTATRKAIDVICKDFNKEINEAKSLIEEQSQSMNGEDEEEGNQNSEPSSRNVLSPSGQNELTQTNVRRRLFDVSNKTEQNQHQQVYGDGLTCERHNDAHNARTGGRTAEDRLEGLEPCPQEFHKRMLLLQTNKVDKKHSIQKSIFQDTWNEFFDVSSSTEKGTLFNIKNAFNHRSVGKDVSKCFNHAVDLLNQVTDSFTLLHLMQLMQIDDIEDIPPDFPKTASAQKVFLNHKATQLIESIWHNCGAESIDPAEIPRDDNSQICNCKDGNCVALGDNTPLESPWFCTDSCQAEAGMYRFCTCKKDRGLDIEMIWCDNQSCSNGTWFHVDCVNIDKIPDGKWLCSPTCEKSSKETEDHKLNYNTGLLWRGLNDKIRRTAVRNGDGPAMIRFWKLDLVQFHINHHPKYFILAHRLKVGRAFHEKPCFSRTARPAKGFSVDKVVPDSVRDKFHIVAKSGTTATTDEHLKNLFAKLEELKLKDPSILIWFGTCEITTKGKYIYLRNYPYQNIESILTSYRELRDKILARFKYVTIIFLECRYYSISTFNTTIREGKKNKDILDQNNNRTKPTNYSLVVKKYSGTRIVTKKERNKRHYPVLVIDKTKGFRSVTQASSLDKELCYQVDDYNRQLKLLNKKYRAPRFSQDQIISNKPKNKTRVRYRKTISYCQMASIQIEH
ncbi:unnamed protein product [Mytilus coruscus]|uniref:Zinc finger PHD-type domain-containing protein n=1 Tax=Mytilus coruscus TaxID=42192 RepID=A0A6J8BFU7_MYTCO|nr:unnamed protein product [Mytilus coruscus]